MNIIGKIAVAIGIVILIISFGMDTAPEGTHNIGLLQQQLMIFQLGGILTLTGAMLSLIGTVIERLEDAGVVPPAGAKVSRGKSPEVQ